MLPWGAFFILGCDLRIWRAPCLALITRHKAATVSVFSQICFTIFFLKKQSFSVAFLKNYKNIEIYALNTFSKRSSESALNPYNPISTGLVSILYDHFPAASRPSILNPADAATS